MKPDDVHPKWNETFTVKLNTALNSSSPPLMLRVMDKETIGSDRFMGSCKIKIGFLSGVKQDTSFYNLMVLCHFILSCHFPFVLFPFRSIDC